MYSFAIFFADHIFLQNSGVVKNLHDAAKTLNQRFNGIFYIFFYHDFAKIYGPPEILQNYTSAAVAHGVRDITLWPTTLGAASSGPLAWDRHSVVTHGVRNIASWAAALCPSVVGHGGSRPASVVAHDASICLPI
jgi:hypothetical protein